MTYIFTALAGSFGIGLLSILLVWIVVSVLVIRHEVLSSPRE